MISEGVGARSLWGQRRNGMNVQEQLWEMEVAREIVRPRPPGAGPRLLDRTSAHP